MPGQLDCAVFVGPFASPRRGCGRGFGNTNIVDVKLYGDIFNEEERDAITQAFKIPPENRGPEALQILRDFRNRIGVSLY